MSETISHTWQTVEQAAVILNVSTRTIARRLSNGSLESRVDENGRRLVLVQVVSPTDAMADASSSTELSHSPANSSAMVTHSSEMTGSMLAVLQTTIDTLSTESRRAKSAAQWAWLGVGTMGMAVLVVAVLLTSSLTKSSMLEKSVAETRTQLRQTQSELMAVNSAKAIAEREKDQAAVELTAATAKIKQTETQLATATEPPARHPTTRPTLLGRLASMMGDDGR